MPWKSIRIDFIGLLPEFKNQNAKYDLITVIIDLHFTMVHLVSSCCNYKAQEITELVFVEVYKHHSLPWAIISDRDK